MVCSLAVLPNKLWPVAMIDSVIPAEEVAAERLRLERHAAALILHCLSESGMSLSEVDERAGHAPGFLKRYIGRLMDGKTGLGGPMVPMALAMGVRLQFTAKQLPPLEPEADASHD